MDLGLKDRVAIVTGASRGIGRACAAELLAEGAHVVVASKDPKRNAEACRALSGKGSGRVLGIPVDIESDDSIRLMVERTLGAGQPAERHPGQQRRAGEPGRSLHFPSPTPTGAEASTRSSTVLPAACATPRSRAMRTRKWGRIVNVTGGAAREPQPRAVATGMNNAAILNLTKAMANELAKDGILLNAVSPAGTLTERVEERIRKEAADAGKSEADVLHQRGAKLPLGRLANPDEVAAVVAFLCSERASYVLGCAWQVDGGAMAAI